MRATALIFRELEGASIDICALSEVLRPGVEKSDIGVEEKRENSRSWFFHLK